MIAPPLAYALAYAERRAWHVFPIRPPIFTADGPRCSCADGAGCDNIGKHPATTWINGGGADRPLWDRRATTDPDIIRAWWTADPTYNVGIATGPSGLLVVDVDKWAGGWASVARLEADQGFRYDTARVLTPSGGCHFYYQRPAGGVACSSHVSRSANGRDDPLGPGIDIRCDGGMVVAPPSIHKSGGRYAWQHQVVPGGVRDVAVIA